MLPTFSVIVPFFNAAPYVRACLEGLIAQDFPADDVEILMVDNKFVAETRPLRLDERLQIFRETVRKGHSIMDRAQLISALGLGMAAWTLGSWSGAAIAPRPGLRG